MSETTNVSHEKLENQIDIKQALYTEQYNDEWGVMGEYKPRMTQRAYGTHWPIPHYMQSARVNYNYMQVMMRLHNQVDIKVALYTEQLIACK